MKKLLALGLLATMALAIGDTSARAVDKGEIDRAVDRGLKALRDMQLADGKWRHNQIGATALAGLALLECGAKEDDKAVLRAADAIRRASIQETQTYSIALSILFFDRLGDPDDVPLIESLMVRLLAGQNAKNGGWFYMCPAISAGEVRRLQAQLNGRKEGAGRRSSIKPGTKRKLEDLAPEIREQLRALDRDGMIIQPGGVPAPGVFGVFGGIGDNSNTQFASLALWVGRRHGVPIEPAVTRLANRFRNTQLKDGGWTYTPIFQQPEMPQMPGIMMMPGMGSTASMTCAGLLGLAIADGATLEYAREHKPDAKLPDLSEDKHLQQGLQALGAVIDNPKGIKPERPQPGFFPAQRVGGRTYYFLWSLERVAVALNLDTIGKKDWYNWGAEILLENQMPNGAWMGDYGDGGVDTCFALLFLKRANLARDLTAQIKGQVKDPGERVLRGGVGIENLRGKKRMLSGIETGDAKPIEKPLQKAVDTESARLAGALVKAQGARRTALLRAMEREKGVMYTEGLAAAIPKLEGETHRKARQALANRLTRMKDDTLADYLQDEDAEIRRGAALAVGQKDSKKLVPNLISLLRDSETSVVRASHASLKALTGQDFGPSATATREERDQAVLKWIAWWSKQRKKATKE
ncbi:MAG TPA: HEAT repeat domain-containing protein [Gemmataceae bacterium]|nr:HEAT repeat domain-containing protein [Gemmataceae bacterium]